MVVIMNSMEDVLVEELLKRMELKVINKVLSEKLLNANLNSYEEQSSIVLLCEVL